MGEFVKVPKNLGRTEQVKRNLRSRPFVKMFLVFLIDPQIAGGRQGNVCFHPF